MSNTFKNDLKIQFRGIVQDVLPPKVFGNTKIQNVVVLKPGYVDEFGTKQSADEHYQFKIFNASIDKFNLDAHALFGEKVEVSGYVSSRLVEGTNGKEDWYSMDLRLSSINKIEVPAGASGTAENNDGLPF